MVLPGRILPLVDGGGGGGFGCPPVELGVQRVGQETGERRAACSATLGLGRAVATGGCPTKARPAGTDLETRAHAHGHAGHRYPPPPV